MNAVLNINSARSVDVTGPWKVDASRGGHNGALSSQWMMRPADQRFLSLADLYEFTSGRSQSSFARNVETRDLRVIASLDDAERMRIVGPGIDGELAPNHWSFGQLCARVKAPAGYMRDLPAGLAALNLQYGLQSERTELIKVYGQRDNLELRAATGPEYGRVHDHELVRGLIRLNEMHDGRWKVPGVIDWSQHLYNPRAAVTSESTTLYASDRDCFVFLCDDLHPIEVGKLDTGEPDLMFRGLMAWNSETGSKTLGLSMFYLRAVCQNRNLWGVEGMQEIKIRHSKNAPARLAHELLPALRQFSDAGTSRLVEGVKEAKAIKVGTDDDDVMQWLGRQAFTKPQAKDIMTTCLAEEGHPARSIWDIAQGLTAAARKCDHQDERVSMERAAGRILDKVA
jgi:hypothetical protein